MIKRIKKFIIKQQVKYFIRIIKKETSKNEPILRVLIHYLLLDMIERETSELRLVYDAPEVTSIEMHVNAKLVDKNNKKEKGENEETHN